MAKLDGKVALVSGSGRGIGRCIALKLATEGARVVVNDLDDEPAAQVVEEIEKAGGTAALCTGNVCDASFPDRFVATAVDQFGGVDIVVNNAGYTWDNVIQKMSDDQFQAVLDVHLVAPFRILKAAMGPMRAAAEAEKAAGTVSHRKVVNISSTSGVFGNAGQSNYAAGKAGVVGLTKTLAKEWGRYGINVNAVAFGLIHTRLTQPLSGEAATIEVDGKTLNVGVRQAHLDAAEKLLPLGRGGYPEEAAGAVYLFCIPESDFVTGQVLVCDGGRV
jgi:3-oxoacyl-[acyl-carrier protein] reductase